MKFKFFTISLLLILIATTIPNSAQTRGFRGGVQFNVLSPANEFKADDNIFKNFSFLGRGFLRFGFSPYLMGEIGAGYGEYTGIVFGEEDDIYKSTIVPFEFRLNIYMTKSEGASPYIFLGLGGMYFDVTDPIAISSVKPVKETEGIVGLGTLGLGLQFDWFELNAGVSMTTNDDINNYIDGDAPDSYYFFGMGLAFGGGPYDSDNDGLLDNDEEKLGTDPENPDTDGDGLTDGEEVRTYSTNPLKADSDDDGLTDSEEIKTYRTDPNKPDMDNDGLKDGAEVMEYKTDPLQADTDGDGLKDGDEVKTHRTNPLKTDTDGDSLSDAEEVNTYKTDPLKVDSDGDELADNEEISKYNTHPLKVDTDGGSVTDGAEVKRGTDPLDPEDDIVKIGVPIVLEGINFETGKFDITPGSAEVLDKSFRTLQNNPDITVEISGHTDNVGSESSNLVLSQRRAEAVRDWLVSRGINADRIAARGYGESKPIAPNDNPEGRYRNRRIEFTRIK